MLHMECCFIPSVLNNHQMTKRPVKTVEGDSSSRVSLEEAIRSKFKELIHLVKDDDAGTSQPGGGRVARQYDRRVNRPIVGSKAVEKGCGIKAAVAYSHLHLYRLHPETTIENVKMYLLKDFPEVLVEKLNSAHPDVYSSFKISVSEINQQRAMDPDLWPEGARINRFFLARRKQDGNRST